MNAPSITREDVAGWTQWSESYACLYPGYGDTEGEPMFRSKEAFEDFVDMATGFYESLPSEFRVYRAVAASSADSIDLINCGESWSTELLSAVEFGTHNGSNFVIVGTADKSGVDAESTVKNFVQFSAGLDAESELEVVIPNDERYVTDKRIVPMREARKMIRL